MLINKRIGKYRIRMAIEKVEDVIGVQSKLRDGNHVLLWDFDNVGYLMVESTLKQVQNRFELSRIIICATGSENGYHAYCLQRCSFMNALSILAATVCVDPGFVRLGAFKGEWTLRVSEKNGHDIVPVAELYSNVADTVEVEELCDFVQFEARGYHKQ